jgi:hypothetical protein
LRRLLHNTAVRLGRDERGWRVAVVLIALGAAVVRLVIIAHTRGGADLRIYTYFSRLGLHGINPFNPPTHGEYPPLQSDNPPVEIALLAGLLAIHNAPVTLRLLFVASDVILVVFVGLCFPRSRQWRAAFIVFYAFNPFVLIAWTAFAEDKTIVLLGITVWLWALATQREWTSWVMATLLTAFKFLGTYAAPQLAVDSFRRRGRAAIWPVSLFAAGFLLSYLPWFPHSLDTLSRRNVRLAANPPIHASWTLLLSRLGIYAPIEAKILTIAGIVLVFAQYVVRRIDISQAVVWSIFAGFIFLPNNAFNRLLLITLPFMLITEFSQLQWVAIWIVASVSALAALIATRGVPHALHALANPLTTLFAKEATVRHVLWMSLLPTLVIGFHVINCSTKPAEPDGQRARPTQPGETATAVP